MSPGKGYGVTHGWLGLRVSLVTGGAAGPLTLTGIKAPTGKDFAGRGDQLIAVIESNGTTGLLTDLTSEFSISADDTIDNTGGTATTADTLLVIWNDQDVASSVYGG